MKKAFCFLTRELFYQFLFFKIATKSKITLGATSIAVHYLFQQTNVPHFVGSTKWVIINELSQILQRLLQYRTRSQKLILLASYIRGLLFPDARVLANARVGAYMPLFSFKVLEGLVTRTLASNSWNMGSNPSRGMEF